MNHGSWTRESRLISPPTRDLTTGRLVSRHDSTVDLYPFTKPTFPSAACLVASPTSTWHNRLGHPGVQTLHLLSRRLFISCNHKLNSTSCHACQIANSKRLSFFDP